MLNIVYLLFFIIHIATSYTTEWHGVNNPRVSIITSIYNGDEFIEDFLADIVQQTIFDQCELILINAHSPGNEYNVIQTYLKQHSNIFYYELDEDPGLYGVWNIAIHLSRAAYLTNANLDDRVHHKCYEIHAAMLDTYQDIDLVYSDYAVCQVPVKSFNQALIERLFCARLPEFSLHNLLNSCLPNDHPMWRKSMHERYGYFDESFRIAGDWQMWLRAASQGAQFKKINQVLGIHYDNPVGLSTNRSSDGPLKESNRVKAQFTHLYSKC